MAHASDKNCRVCTDFKSWTKMKLSERKSDANNNKTISADKNVILSDNHYLKKRKNTM